MHVIIWYVVTTKLQDQQHVQYIVQKYVLCFQKNILWIDLNHEIFSHENLYGTN